MVLKYSNNFNNKLMIALVIILLLLLTLDFCIIYASHEQEVFIEYQEQAPPEAAASADPAPSYDELKTMKNQLMRYLHRQDSLSKINNPTPTQ